MLFLSKINFDKLQYKDLNMILEWRNDNSIRNKMKNKHVISFKEHKKWFYGVVNDTTCEWMIIKYEEKKVGVIGIKEIDKNKSSCTWGMYLSPKIRKLGIGVLAEIQAIDRMFIKPNVETIWGEVLSNNRSIMKIHKRCGFKIIEEVNGIIKISMTKGGWKERRNSIIEEFMLK